MWGTACRAVARSVLWGIVMGGLVVLGLAMSAPARAWGGSDYVVTDAPLPAAAQGAVAAWAVIYDDVTGYTGVPIGPGWVCPGQYGCEVYWVKPMAGTELLCEVAAHPFDAPVPANICGGGTVMTLGFEYERAWMPGPVGSGVAWDAGIVCASIDDMLGPTCRVWVFGIPEGTGGGGVGTYTGPTAAEAQGVANMVAGGLACLLVAAGIRYGAANG